ncbi:hypothetical protein AXK12_03960 [Cephaloticoccus capnophilus]|uniref:Uncharacterized protein n=1 Tax=Cephaloticoccus capnophilus TaxID=1548208 RepID=A0A139SNP1_9BACT|nr:hypothetical protein AXK12_03960 [Cephaloticoccus capnophilus]
MSPKREAAVCALDDSATQGSQAFGRKDPKLGGGSLLVIFPTSPKRVITLLSLLLLSLSQRDRGECFQIWDFVIAR